MPASPDQLLARFCASRDPDLLAAVFSAVAPGLLARARRLLSRINGDRGGGTRLQLAEDVVQETFLTLLAHPDRYDPSRPAIPYLQGILDNKIHTLSMQEVRRGKLARLWSSLSNGNGDRDDRTPDQYPDHRAPNGPEATTHKELAERVRSAIAALPEPYGEVLHRYLERDQSPAQIGRELGRAEGTVRVQVHRGLLKLRLVLRGALSVLAIKLLCGRVPARPPTPAATPRMVPVAAGIVLTLTGCLLWFAVAGYDDGNTELAAAEDSTTDRWLDRERQVHAPEAERPRLVASGPAPEAALLLRWPDGRPAAGVGVILNRHPGTDPGLHARPFATGRSGLVPLGSMAPGDTFHILTDRNTEALLQVPAPPAVLVHDLPPGHSVRGRVLDGNGLPVSNAAVWSSPGRKIPWAGQVVTRCDGDGNFHLEHVTGEILISALAKGHTPARLRHLRPEDSGPPLQLVVGGPGCRITGTVRDARGQPVADAVVLVGDHPRAFYRLPGLDWLAPTMPPLRTRTDEGGRFAMDDLPAGRLQVLVRATDKVTRSVSVRIHRGNDHHVAVVLQEGVTVRGRVLDRDGHPVVGAVLHASGVTFAQWISANSDREGHFCLEGLHPQRGLVEIEANGFDPEQVVLGETHRAGEPLAVFLHRHAGSAGLLVDGMDRPVAREPGFEVMIEPCWSRQWAPVPPPQPVGEGGRFQIHPLEVPGSGFGRTPRYLVRNRSQQVWLPAIRVLDAPSLTLRVPRELTQRCFWAGQLTSDQGPLAVEDAVLVAQRRGFIYPVPLEIDAACGRFRAGPLPPGCYRFCWRSRAGRFPCTYGGRYRLRLEEQAEAGSLHFTWGTLDYSLRRRDDRAIRRFAAWLEDSRGNRWSLSRVTPRGRIAVAPGSYRLRAIGMDFVSVRGEEVEVRAGETTRLDLQVQEGEMRHIWFRLPETGDAPVHAQVLDLAAAPVASEAPVDVAPDGHTGIALVLAAGDYRLRVRSGCQTYEGPLVLRDEGPDEVSVALQPLFLGAPGNKTDSPENQK